MSRSQSDSLPSKELVDSLARFADHNEVCPRGQWKPEHEDDFDMPDCTCGLELLLDRANVFVQRYPDESPPQASDLEVKRAACMDTQKGYLWIREDQHDAMIKLLQQRSSYWRDLYQKQGEEVLLLKQRVAELERNRDMLEADLKRFVSHAARGVHEPAAPASKQLPEWGDPGKLRFARQLVANGKKHGKEMFPLNSDFLLWLLDKQLADEPAGHLRQGMEAVDASELTVDAIRERATAFNHWFKANGGFKGYEAQAIDALLDRIDALETLPAQPPTGNVESLREALRPFAEIGHWMHARPQVPDDEIVVEIHYINNVRSTFTRGDFKRASLAYRASETKDAAP